MGDSGTKSYQLGICGLICLSFGVLQVKKIENHCATGAFALPEVRKCQKEGYKSERQTFSALFLTSWCQIE